MSKRLCLIAAAVMATGCVTQFTGSPKVGGRPQCEQVCNGWDMELTGMVQMGEFSNGCICQVRGKGQAPQATTAAAGEAAIAGVWVQMQDAQNQHAHR